jgi:hypothetical protein
MTGRILVIACTLAALSSWLSGASALPDGGANPRAWLPPGAPSPDDGPSTAIFPPQKLGILFDHRKHVKDLKLSCGACHDKAAASTSAADRLLPGPATCDPCHKTDHSDLGAVRRDTSALGQCALCHREFTGTAAASVAPTDVPAANMRFNHKAHADRNIGCGQCHGSVEQMELATRDQLPRMAGCLRCHNMPPSAAGGAKSECSVCHLETPDGRLRTGFPTGQMKPPQWLHNAQHASDFIRTHKRAAADDSQFCGRCHSESYCTDCHDGKVRPRHVHPNDWISMHPVAAQLNNPRCTSCHAGQSFCLDCHTRAGVTKSGPNAQGYRFHPSGWVDLTSSRAAGRHGWEAKRNLAACVSCHTERDCASCHATTGRSGLGLNPHPAGFASDCASRLRRNSRPCLVCHDPSDLGTRCR